jgi:O-antigen/teichoic acid export membrane protein
MGIIIRQGIWISVSSYLGVLLGYVNIILLFPQFLELDQIGSVRFIQSTSLLFLQFAQVGLSAVILRYYPIIFARAPRVSGFVPSMLLISLFFFLLFLAGFTVLQDYIWQYFSSNAPQTQEYAGLIVALVFLMSMQAVLEAYSRSVLEAVVVNVLRDVVLRVITTLLILSYALHWIGFITFLWLFVGIYALNLVLLAAYLAQRGHLRLSLDFSFWRYVNVREIVSFSLFTFLGGSGSSIFRRVDAFMITSMLGLSATGIYTIMFNVAVVIEVPMAAIAQISQPIIAKSFATNDLPTIATIYRKSAINQQLIGSLLFIGIWANLPNLFAIMPEGEAFKQGYWVVVIIGFSKLIDMSTGSNNEIINMSEHYRFNMLMMLLLGAVAVATNWLLIPRLGIDGAALATLLTVVAFNAIKLVFIYRKYQLLPFSRKNLWLLIITALVLYPALRIEPLGSVWVDLPVRSVGITLVFGALVFFLRVSDDANQLVLTVLHRIGLRSSKRSV